MALSDRLAALVHQANALRDRQNSKHSVQNCLDRLPVVAVATEDQGEPDQ